METTKTVQAMLELTGFESVTDLRHAARTADDELAEGRAIQELSRAFRDLGNAEADVTRYLGELAGKATRERDRLNDGLAPGVEFIVQGAEKLVEANIKMAEVTERIKLLTYVLRGPAK